MTEPSTRLLDIERRSIEFVPENERHGRVIDQGPFWFLSNFHFFAIAIGFVGPSLGLTLGYSALAGRDARVLIDERGYSSDRKEERARVAPSVSPTESQSHIDPGG